MYKKHKLIKSWCCPRAKPVSWHTCSDRPPRKRDEQYSLFSLNCNIVINMDAHVEYEIFNVTNNSNLSYGVFHYDCCNNKTATQLPTLLVKIIALSLFTWMVMSSPTSYISNKPNVANENFFKVVDTHYVSQLLIYVLYASFTHEIFL